MTDTPQAAPSSADAPEKPASPPEKEENFFVFLLKLLLLVVAFRSFLLSPFNIPSESMMPRLHNGDYLLAAKWPYGYSKYSLPFSVPLIPGRLFAAQPERGDIVILKAPPGNDVDYIKRVIGLPGDQIQMKGGQLWLNGKPVTKRKVADFEIAVSPNTHCYLPQFEATRADGTAVCRYPQYRETLPNGVTYNVLDLTENGSADNTSVYEVPEGHYFMMGDNRDNSQDSRYLDVVGYVPIENYVGRADIIFFSISPDAVLWRPWEWPFLMRWMRFFNFI